ncbi:hypothetical protein SERLA73DRAFT_169537 [Serpula lacrymans var. lacrymans S7.3]|uniref:Uncharacterized protein n=2 Tax=Serpula lacrymans var. lacrymans TaxID=341189 RepID=F8Q3K3_SERL3|nr:hypothetical protein SERLA73DRAFT_169537 [Serpula lacrymans var. lacrymans S7.3]
MALAEVFHMEAYGNIRIYSDIETPGSESQFRWCSWQFSIAHYHFRLHKLRVSLGDILPFSDNYPELEKRKVGGANRIGGDVVAGAQWII